ncbi:hypothetical protein SLA2020_436310 [Shorea laevis]
MLTRHGWTGEDCTAVEGDRAIHVDGEDHGELLSTNQVVALSATLILSAVLSWCQSPLVHWVPRRLLSFLSSTQYMILLTVEV